MHGLRALIEMLWDGSEWWTKNHVGRSGYIKALIQCLSEGGMQTTMRNSGHAGGLIGQLLNKI
jgi:hypothetical protein